MQQLEKYSDNGCHTRRKGLRSMAEQRRDRMRGKASLDATFAFGGRIHTERVVGSDNGGDIHRRNFRERIHNDVAFCVPGNGPGRSDRIDPARSLTQRHQYFQPGRAQMRCDHQR